MDNNFIKLASIDVAEKIEKKNGLSYLSWAWAWDQLLRQDPNAEFEYPEPTRFPDETVMVYCIVTAFGKQRKAHLPVMDYKNQPIKNPNAFAMNTAMQRCFVKAIALHGLGLYIYAGEDLPEGANDEKEAKFTPEQKSLQATLFTKLDQCMDELEIVSYIDEHTKEIESLPEEMSSLVNQEIENRLDCIKRGVPLPIIPHRFAGVDDAIKWAGKMFPLIQTFKSLKTLDVWENENRPFINGLDCLKAKKYEKDGKQPKERFLDALAAKRSELTNIDKSQTPLG